jgi:hypothetical protein
VSLLLSKSLRAFCCWKFILAYLFCCLSSSPKLLLGFGLDLQSGDLSVSKDQPQRFTLPLGSGVISYHWLKVHILGCSAFCVVAGTSGLLEVSVQTAGTSGYH